MLPLKSINREANQEDIDQQLKNIQQEKNAEVYCNNLIKTMKLNMNITHVQMLQFGKKMVFYFTAPSRVDFRDLVKDLVGKLKMRIELRQISIRDRAACVGAVGSCGQITCCSSFLKSYGAVNIKMAKNQNLALIPSKLNGVCGQIKCCIKFENEVYTFKREKLPREGQLIQTRNGDKGKVQNLSVLNETFVMKTDKGQLRRYLSNQFDKNINLPKDWKYPTEFSSFINELHLTIGNLNDIPEVATSSQVETSSQTKSETETEVVQKLNENSSSKSREKSQQTQQPQQHKKKKSYRNNRNRNKNNQKNTSKQ